MTRASRCSTARRRPAGFSRWIRCRWRALDVAPTPEGPSSRLRYALGGPAGRKQSVALLYDAPNGALPFERVTFESRAEHPMRVSVQLRVRGQARRRSGGSVRCTSTRSTRRTPSISTISRRSAWRGRRSRRWPTSAASCSSSSPPTTSPDPRATCGSRAPEK